MMLYAVEADALCVVWKKSVDEFCHPRDVRRFARKIWVGLIGGRALIIESSALSLAEGSSKWLFWRVVSLLDGVEVDGGWWTWLTNRAAYNVLLPSVGSLNRYNSWTSGRRSSRKWPPRSIQANSPSFKIFYPLFTQGTPDTGSNGREQPFKTRRSEVEISKNNIYTLRETSSLAANQNTVRCEKR